MTTNALGAVDLLCTILAAACWSFRPELGPWPLLLIAAGRLARFAAGGRPAFRSSAFTLPLLAFLGTALIGALIAYDPLLAWAKFWRIAAGIALGESLAHAPAAVRLGKWRPSPVRAFLALLPPMLGAYFLLTNPWALYMGKIALLDPAMRWFASWQLPLPGHRLHPNLVGGVVAAFLPLQVAVLWPPALRSPRRPLRLAGAALLTGISALSLLLSAARGAWIALALACLAWWLLARIRARLMGRPAVPGAARLGTPALQVSLLPLFACVAAVATAQAFPGVLDALARRLELLRNGLDLALDYPFTGLGLDGFQMAYSTYVLLVHVGAMTHSHNLYLEVWLEQGLLGVAALIWLLAVAGQTIARSLRAEASRPLSSVATHLPFAALCLPAAAGLLVLLLHGMFDDAFYATRAVVCMFVPFGVLEGIRLEDRARAGDGVAPEGLRSKKWLPVAATAVIGLLAVALLLPGVRAAFQANLGALDQTRSELSLYRWPDWPLQDEVRRSPEIDLRPAVAHYAAALALDPHNATANRRMGQIALALGETDTARAYLQKAYEAAPGQRATRQLLGETYALAGDYPHAVALWKTVDNSFGQLDVRAWWYGHLGNRDAAMRVSAAAALAWPRTPEAPAKPSQP